MDTVLYVPGRFPYDIASDQSKIDRLARRGKSFERIILPHDGTVDDWLELVGIKYRKLRPANTILVGFSLGAVVAYLLAAEEVPKKLILASLPAWCRERIGTIPKSSTERFTNDQIRAFKAHSFDALAPRITCPTELLVGSHEAETSSSLWENVHVMASLIPHARRTIVPGVAHEIEHPKYEQALVEAL